MVVVWSMQGVLFEMRFNGVFIHPSRNRVFGCTLSSSLSVKDRSAGKTRREITEETEEEREKPFCPCRPINLRRTRKCQQD